MDEEDYEWLARYDWFYFKGYAARNVVVGGRRFATPMHRVIMMTPEGMETDHINRNRLDNRKCNLRVCTKSQNQCNATARRQNRSGYKGVTAHGERWKAQIQVDGRKMHLGVYDSPEEAAIAFDRAAVELHGEFARLNFPVKAAS